MSFHGPEFSSTFQWTEVHHITPNCKGGQQVESQEEREKCLENGLLISAMWNIWLEIVYQVSGRARSEYSSFYSKADILPIELYIHIKEEKFKNWLLWALAHGAIDHRLWEWEHQCFVFTHFWKGGFLCSLKVSFNMKRMVRGIAKAKYPRVGKHLEL